MTIDGKGFISLHRKLMENPVWSDPNYLKLWIYCLLEASHKDRDQLVGHQVVNLKRGQFVTGRNVLADDMNRGVKPKHQLNNRTWFRYLQNLETWEMLTIKSTNKFSVITINNYDTYQDVFNKNVHHYDHQLSNSCPATDHQLSTNNNVNNANNDNKLSNSTRDSEFAEVIQFYQKNLQSGVTESPYNNGLIIDFYEEWGSELLISAMKLSAQQEKRGTAYLGGILKKWREAGVKTVEDARNYETQLKASRNKQSNKIVHMNKRESQYDQYDYGF